MLRQVYGVFLVETLKFEEGIEHLEKAVKLEPNDPTVIFCFKLIRFSLGDIFQLLMLDQDLKMWKNPLSSLSFQIIFSLSPKTTMD